MPFVQALKRLITTNDISSTNGATVNDTSEPTSDNASNVNPSLANSNGTHSTILASKTHENVKPLSQSLQKKYARGVQYNSKT